MDLLQDTTAKIGHNNPPSDAESLEQKLMEDYERQLSDAQMAYKDANNFPNKIETDEDANRGTDLIKKIVGLNKNFEAIRIKEKEPYLTLGRVVDNFFKKPYDLLNEAKNNVRFPIDDFLKEKAAKERAIREEQARIAREEAEKRATQAVSAAQAEQQATADILARSAAQLEYKAQSLEKAAAEKPAQLARASGVSGTASLRTKWVGEVIDPKSIDLELLRPYIRPEDLQRALNAFVAMGGRELPGARIYEKSETVVR